MNLAKAADTLVDVRAQLAALRVLEEAAADKLKEHFRKTGRAEYRRIRYAKSSSLQLDTKAVKAHLGKDLAKFQRPVDRETLSIIPEAA